MKMPKIKFNKNKKRLFSIISLFIIIFALIAGIILVKQNQNIEEKAGGQHLGSCKEEYLGKSSDFPCENKDCLGDQGTIIAQCEHYHYVGSKEYDYYLWVQQTGCICMGAYPQGDETTSNTTTNNTTTKKSKYKITLTDINISGGVMLEDSNGEGVNRFTKITCSDKEYTIDPAIKVSTTFASLKFNASWTDCTGPDFKFLQTKAPVSQYLVTLTPPQGYTCSSVDVKNNDTGEIIKSHENTCTALISVYKKMPAIYIMYKVKAN